MKQFFQLFLAFFFYTVVSVYGSTMNIQKIGDSTALLIIDIQNFYFENGKLPLVGSVEASLKAKQILEKFRTDKRLVVHIQHMPTTEVKDMNQYEIHANVKPLENEKVFQKHFANSFRETGLLEYLKKMGIKRLVICGMQTHMCVEAATRAATDYGFECILIEDACATRNLTFENKTILAKDVHLGVLAALSGTYAKIVTVEKFVQSN